MELTFKEATKMLEDKDNWKLVNRDKDHTEAATAIYKDKYFTHLRFLVYIYAVGPHYPQFLVNGSCIAFRFNIFQFLLVKLFYRRQLRVYLEKKK